ncbi:hypothetical protein [Providencia rettgeri]|uniref:hypothetical protein n=1 Tax=Providencia rettgeri TaxID=587 RepID=UPI0018C7E09F|nr:hypothetical protein [Providencia rettgeri]MBG5925771.1 hypothetical protein [Providencia rettgeri]
MPSITPLQKAAFDAIDTLHFGQVVMSLIYDEPIEVCYHRILDRINEILKKKGMTGKQAEITKHYILATLEIYLSVDDKYISYILNRSEKNNAVDMPDEMTEDGQLIKYIKKYTLRILSKVANLNGVENEFVDQVVENLINDKMLALSTMPFFIKYRLTERCYAFEYPDAPLGFYHELVSRDIISCSKYSCRADNYKKKADSELSLLFIRAGLIFEFRMLQRSINILIRIDKKNTITFPTFDPKISRTDRKMIADYYKRLVDAFFQEEKPDAFYVFLCGEYVSELNARNLLENIDKFYFHRRMFGGTQARWLGTMGVFDIEASRWDEPNRAIYYEADNSYTISEKIKLKFLDYGFSVSARNLYLRHKEIKRNSYSKIKNYCYFLLEQEYSVPWHDTDSDYYYYKALELKEKDTNE